MPSPERISFATEDPLEAREHIDEAFGARLKVEASAATVLPISFDQIEVGPVAVADLRVPFAVDAELAGEDSYIFTILLRGAVEYECAGGEERFEQGDVFLGLEPDSRRGARADRIRARTVNLPAAFFEEIVGGAEDGARPWRFESLRPIPGGDRRWREAVGFFDEIVTDPATSDEPLITGPTTRLLAAVALSAFPNGAIPSTTRADGRDAQPENLRRAVAFIEENPSRDISVVDIARAANVSPRSVQLAFRRHLDTTPTAYLRKVRLDAAHGQLQAASPDDGTTVTRVARDWGFAKPSRFAALYLEAYGRSPSETLAE
jgi:AraC-like DNA-binding protein